MTSQVELPVVTLHELSTEDCWLRLGAGRLGRIAYVDRGGPIILPLNYVAEDRVLWFRTAAYAQLAVHLAEQVLALEIDGADETDHTGWSVLVRGQAEHVLPGLGTSRHTRYPDPTPWPDGTRTMLFRLVPDEVSGRALALAPG